MAVLDDFAQARAQVQEFLRPQRASIAHFWDEHEKVFFRTEADRSAAREAGDKRKPPTTGVHRLTSTVTCLESLLEAPPWDAPKDATWTNAHAVGVLTEFIEHALSTQDGWQSDDAAWVYCRARTLGGALRLLPSDTPWTSAHEKNATALLTQAWQSRWDAGGSFGLREATKSPVVHREFLEAETSDQQYPANAFLTYWGLLAAAQSNQLGVEPQGAFSTQQQTAARDWLRENLATQVTFHFTKSRHADPQQLAWSICGLIRFTPGTALASTVSAEHELMVAGLRAFFEQQQDGTWATGAPLFHYRNAGNAYAYPYETLAELLSLATSREISRTTADALADALKPYSAELLAALDCAERAGQHLSNAVVAWSSGHHPHRTSPESWATASVYRFAQALRRLVGAWSSQSARMTLGARRAGGSLKTFIDRGASWDLGHGTAGAFLTTAFVQPVRRTVALSRKDARHLPDPDERIIEEKQARSAMLFGPPGTGKTHLVEAIAGALGWDFVEITPAQFLDQGVDHVSARADSIFRQVMELDHCVVLLDEIDELIHKRSPKSETIERFFTTTMLPRLAKLWDAGRILFFVNTNSIKRVDSAIVRSQRFDAALLVLPPGHAVKRALLSEGGLELQSSAESVTAALLASSDIADAKRDIGWLALVRYDQMDALADSIRGELHAKKGTVTDEVLVAGLRPIARELARLDWDGNMVKPPGGKERTQPNVSGLYGYERRDARMVLWAALHPDQNVAFIPEHLEVVTIDGESWVPMGLPDSPEQWAADLNGALTTDGVVRFPEPNGHSST